MQAGERRGGLDLRILEIQRRNGLVDRCALSEMDDARVGRADNERERMMGVEGW